jgi:hypothetical protein
MAKIQQCEEALSRELHRPVALRLTGALQSSGRTRMTAIVQVAAESTDNQEEMARLAAHTVNGCYPGGIDETRVEKVAARTRSRSDR